MKEAIKGHKALPLTIFASLLMVALGFSAAPTFGQALEDQINQALQPKKPVTRGLGRPQPTADPKAVQEKQFINQLRSRSISVQPSAPAAAEEREKIINIAKDKPKIDLEVNFDYDSADVTPRGMEQLKVLGKVLSKAEFKNTVFFINGHTDGKGSPDYNLGLSQRRAEAVKQVLVEQFSLRPDALIAKGFGKEHLKRVDDPMGGENRRVEIVNTEQPATAEAK